MVIYDNMRTNELIFGIWGVNNLEIWDLRGQKFRDLGFEGYNN